MGVPSLEAQWSFCKTSLCSLFWPLISAGVIATAVLVANIILTSIERDEAEESGMEPPAARVAPGTVAITYPKLLHGFAKPRLVDFVAKAPQLPRLIPAGNAGAVPQAVPAAAAGPGPEAAPAAAAPPMGQDILPLAAAVPSPATVPGAVPPVVPVAAAAPSVVPAAVAALKRRAAVVCATAVTGGGGAGGFGASSSGGLTSTCTRVGITGGGEGAAAAAGSASEEVTSPGLKAAAPGRGLKPAGHGNGEETAAAAPVPEGDGGDVTDDLRSPEEKVAAGKAAAAAAAAEEAKEAAREGAAAVAEALAAAAATAAAEAERLEADEEISSVVECDMIAAATKHLINGHLKVNGLCWWGRGDLHSKSLDGFMRLLCRQKASSWIAIQT